MTTPPGPAQASCSALRLIQKTSGLFNKGETDVADLFASVNTEGAVSAESTNHGMKADASLATAATDDIFSILESSTCNELPSLALDDLSLEGSINMGDGEFLEEFIDLSNLIEPQESNPPVDLLNLDEVFLPGSSSNDTTLCLEAVGGLGLKRTATEAFPLDTTPPSANTDHDHYTCRDSLKKRRQSEVSSVSSVISEEDKTLKVKTMEEKYRIRRDKNNVASKRSRETRKQKYVVMEERATELETINAGLRIKIEKLEALTKQMKEALVERLAKK